MGEHERFLRIDAIMKGGLSGGFRQIHIETDDGTVLARHYPVADARTAALFVGGVGGGWDSPARDLYPRLCADLRAAGTACLRVRFRRPTDLHSSALDVLAGLVYLEQEGVQRAALVGHSFGGAVVIQAAAASNVPRTVVTLATQSYGADAVAKLAPRCSILIVHGTRDRTLPPEASEYVHRMAQEPKELRLFEGAGHDLDEVADELYALVHRWITEQLHPVTRART